MNFRETYPHILLGVYFLIWLWAAAYPRYRSVWIDENILPIIFVFVLIATYSRFRFSNTSYTLIFLFLVLHAIGGHYSYSEMPLFDYIKELYGLSRNHYDRVVHFLFGVLMFYPMYEVSTRIFKVPRGWRGLVIAFFIIAALKGIFESIEYTYTALRNNSLTVSNYLGEQGDSLDAVKDITLGIFGGLLSMIFVGMRRLSSHKKN